MATIELPYNWNPRKYQLPLWNHLENGGKRAVAVWHRRAGKDEVCLHRTAVAMMERPATYWYMLPKANQARKAIWDAINPHTGIRRIDEAFPEVLRAKTRDDEMFIKFKNGAVFQVVGSDNYDSLVGSPPAGVVFSEWPLSKEDAWAYLRPIFKENDGWALFNYTPRGDNHGKKMFDLAEGSDDWFSQLLTADDTGVFTQKQLDDELKELIAQYGPSRGKALFEQEYYCSWIRAYTGKAVYKNFSRKMHVSEESLLPFVIEGTEKGRQIVRGWDNTGLYPACVLMYQNTLGQMYIFKEFTSEDVSKDGDGVDIVDFADAVIAWCEGEFPEARYRDIGDPAGQIRDSRKKSPKQHIADHCGIIIEDGIQTLRVRISSVEQRLAKMVQGEPAVLIDKEGCPKLIEGFEGAYCYPEIGDTGLYKTEPDKNGALKVFTDVHDSVQYPFTRLFSYKDEDTWMEEDDYSEGRSDSGGY
jgi:hypothetical protein